MSNFRESINNYQRALKNYNTDIRYWQRKELWWIWCGQVHLYMKQVSAPLKFPHGVYGKRFGELEPGDEGIPGYRRQVEARVRRRAEQREQAGSLNPTERGDRHRDGRKLEPRANTYARSRREPAITSSMPSKSLSSQHPPAPTSFLSTAGNSDYPPVSAAPSFALLGERPDRASSPQAVTSARERDHHECHLGRQLPVTLTPTSSDKGSSVLLPTTHPSQVRHPAALISC
jgi:hypothetical protein